MEAVMKKAGIALLILTLFIGCAGQKLALMNAKNDIF